MQSAAELLGKIVTTLQPELVKRKPSLSAGAPKKTTKKETKKDKKVGDATVVWRW